jgi:transcription-repair coupling factor (superfamily II helicase)
MCRRANIEKVDAGPKGAVISLRGNTFADPGALVGYIARGAGTVKLRPDQKIVFTRPWDTPSARVKGLQSILGQIVALIDKKKAA